MACAGKQAHVLFIVENLPVPFDRRVWQEATTLAKAGYKVSIICPTGKDATARFETLEDVDIYRHPLPVEGDGLGSYALEYGIALSWELLLALKVHRKTPVDIIHACNPPDTIFLIGRLFKMLFGTKFVFDHHDINPELFEAKFGHTNGFAYKVLCWLEKQTFKTADLCIATNESYKQIAIERGGKDPDKVHVVRSGPSLERLKIQDPDPALKQGKKYLIGYVGVMGDQEGIPYLLEAAKHIVVDQGRDDVHFTLVGGGPSLEKLQKQVKDMGLGDAVTFTGRVPDETLLAVLNTADVCVNPDSYNAMNDKSTMNKIMEYMALGKPIVQFDLTEGRVSAEKASLYAKHNDAIDFAECILTLLKSPQKRSAMGRFGRTRVEEVLAWTHEAPKLTGAYGTLSV